MTGFVRSAEICWRRDLIFTTFGAPDGGAAGTQPLPFTLEFGLDDAASGKKGCENPNAPSNPILALIQFGWGIDSPEREHVQLSRDGPPRDLPGGVQIDAGLQSHCAAGPPCTGEKFPENHLLAVMTLQSNIDLATIRPGLSRIMGYFFVAGANITVKQDVVIAGMLRAGQHLLSQHRGLWRRRHRGKDSRLLPGELLRPAEDPERAARPLRGARPALGRALAGDARAPVLDRVPAWSQRHAAAHAFRHLRLSIIASIHLGFSSSALILLRPLN